MRECQVNHNFLKIFTGRETTWGSLAMICETRLLGLSNLSRPRLEDAASPRRRASSMMSETTDGLS